MKPAHDQEFRVEGVGYTVVWVKKAVLGRLAELNSWLLKSSGFSDFWFGCWGCFGSSGAWIARGTDVKRQAGGPLDGLCFSVASACGG